MIVNFKNFVYTKLVSFYFQSGSLLFVKDSELELAIINVGDTVFLAMRILFNFLHFDVRVRLTTDHVLGEQAVMAA